MTDTARVLVRMPPETHAWLKSNARRRGMSVNTLIVEAIEAHRIRPGLDAGQAIVDAHGLTDGASLWVEGDGVRYELRGLTIRRDSRDGLSRRTYPVTTLDSDKWQAQWQVFAQAIWEGDGEVAAVHAIDG